MYPSTLPIAQTALDHAFAGLAAGAGVVREVPVVCLAHVALVPRHPGLALALAVHGALEAGGALGVTVAVQTRLPPVGVLDRGDVVIGLRWSKTS